MDAHWTSDSPETLDTEALAVPLFELDGDESPDTTVDGWTGGLLAELYESGEFKGKANETLLLQRPEGMAARRLLLVGAGKRSAASANTARDVAGAAGRRLRGKGVTQLAVALLPDVDTDAQGQAIAEGLALSQYRPDTYKTKEKPDTVIAELAVIGDGSQAALENGIAIAEAQNFARELVNEPGNRLPPRVLAERALTLDQEPNLEVEVIKRKGLEELGMGALLGVAQGSAEPPRLIIVRYRPEGDPQSDVHLGLVGKGVTFDTGGISIKPAADMDRMKDDMAGGAAVLGAMKAIAALKPSILVTAVVPSVENMPGASAQRPGDVVKTLSGKTVEILNTDAEGRLILADALTYAQQIGCNRLVDAATLTGAIMVALGYERAGLFSNDDGWRSALVRAAASAGEKVWPMPLDDEYRALLKSAIADIPNLGPRWGGAITAAAFLKEFADPAPWAHLDIAGVAWLEEAKPAMPKGPSGFGVRTFVELAMSLGGAAK